MSDNLNEESDIDSSDLSSIKQDTFTDLSEDESLDLSPPRNKSELEEKRQQNMKKLQELLSSFKSNPEYKQVMNGIKMYSEVKPKKKPQKRNKVSGETTSFRFSGNIPIERRSSARLKNKPPIYTNEDLDDVDYSSFKRKRYYDSDNEFEDLEEVIYMPKKKRTPRSTVNRHVIQVEDVTEEMISNIATKVSRKVYSDKGTSCHQCRQKTLDQKTCCRSENCYGVQGQFCGVCIVNRYGEDAAVALKDPNWTCFVCRGICNCSFCRARAGKRPTGQMVNVSQQMGFKSVKDYLESLKNLIDVPSRPEKFQKLYGFSDGGRVAHMKGGITENIIGTDCQICVWKVCDDPENLLAFSKDGKAAYMGSKIVDVLAQLGV